MTLGEGFTAGGYVTGALVLYTAARSRHMATGGIAKIAAIGLLAGIVGAKLTQLLDEGARAMSHGWLLSGRSIIGGIVAGWIGVEIAKRAYRIRRPTGDLFALALPAGEAVGRIGCFFNGCCYGKECNMPWAIWQHGAWRHPTQIYSALCAAAIFGVLLLVRKRDLAEGALFRLYLVLFAACRFALEFARVSRPVFGGLTAAQWFCVELAGMSLFMTWFAARRLTAAAVAN